MLWTILVDDKTIILNEMKEILESQGVMVTGTYSDP